MNCPYCDEELVCEDHYGFNMRTNSFGDIMPGYRKQGDIYRCNNEDCEAYGEHFHLPIGHNELCEGYPC